MKGISGNGVPFFNLPKKEGEEA
jgi:hypothetical protein